MKFTSLKKSKGLTLVELVITFFIISLILMSATRAFYQYYKTNIRTNERAIKTALATARLEEWKAIRGEFFLPGVKFALYNRSVNTSTGVISFSSKVISIPAVTQLDIDCINNSTLIQETGYSCSLIAGVFGNPGFGSPNSCWYEPSSRTVANENVPGDITFTLNCPAGVASILELKMIDYGTKLREQRVVVNGITKNSYSSSNLVPPNGIISSISLGTIDTSTGHVSIEIEQTGTVNNAAVAIANNFTSTSKLTLSAGTGTTQTTPSTTADYSETDTKSYRITSSVSTATSPISLKTVVNTSGKLIGDYLRLWVRIDTADKIWLTMQGGDSNTIVGPTVGSAHPWQQLTRILSADDIGSTEPLTIKYMQNTSTHNATVYINELTTEAATSANNPNAVLSRITLKSLTGFTDPDSTAGAPVTTATYPGYILISDLDPTNTSAGQAIGWTVRVSVSKVNDKYEPIIITNTINK